MVYFEIETKFVGFKVYSLDLDLVIVVSRPATQLK